MKGNAEFRLARLWLALAILAGLIAPIAVGVQDAAAASFKFSPKSGPPGTKVEFTASGLPSGENLTVEGKHKDLDGPTSLCSFTSGNNGNGGCSFSVPKVAPGKLTIEVTGEHVSRSDVGVFNVTREGDGGAVIRKRVAITAEASIRVTRRVASARISARHSMSLRAPN